MTRPFCHFSIDRNQCKWSLSSIIFSSAMCELKHERAKSILDFLCEYDFLTHQIAWVLSTHEAFVSNRNIMSLREVCLIDRHNWDRWFALGWVSLRASSLSSSLRVNDVRWRSIVTWLNVNNDLQAITREICPVETRQISLLLWDMRLKTMTTRELILLSRVEHGSDYSCSCKVAEMMSTTMRQSVHYNATRVERCVMQVIEGLKKEGFWNMLRAIRLNGSARMICQIRQSSD